MFKNNHKNTLLEDMKLHQIDRTYTKEVKLKASKHQSLSSWSKQMNKILEGSFIG